MKFESLKLSTRPNKRYVISFSEPKKTIHFGAKNGSTYIDHKDSKKRKAWKARHTMILKNGVPAYLQKDSASFWSFHLLW